MKFVDTVKVYVQAGTGGDGCLSFRRERYRPRGGPDGGNAGRGGDVVFIPDSRMMSLLDLSYQPRVVAENGRSGGPNNQCGRNGRELIVRVPMGTLVIDPATASVLEDLNQEGKRFVAAKGGRGGRGNAQFATAVHRAPRRVEKGEKGECRWLKLELKLLADVGLIGLPNVGKSSLISKISSARPRIADYPFTTTSPNLGVVSDDDFRSFTVADMPGLVGNAHQGVGLGIQFLKHVERTRLLVHVLDVTRLHDHSLVEDYEVLTEELKAFNPELGEKPQIVAINKIDRIETLDSLKEVQRSFAEKNLSVFLISALQSRGLSPLVIEMVRKLEASESTTRGG